MEVGSFIPSLDLQNMSQISYICSDAIPLLPAPSYTVPLYANAVPINKFTQHIILFLLASLLHGIEASPFHTLKPDPSDGVFPAPTPANSSTNNATPMIATNPAPWLLCLNQANPIDYHNNDQTNCTDDWEIQSRNPVCTKNCRCVDHDTALWFARNTSACNAPINLADKPPFVTAQKIKEIMVDLEKRHRDTVTDSAVEYSILPNSPTIHDDTIDPDSTCTLSCISNEMIAICSKCPVLGQCTKNCIMATNSTLHDTRIIVCSCSGAGGIDKRSVDVYNENPFENLD